MSTTNIDTLGNMKFFSNGKYSIGKVPILFVFTNIFVIGLTTLATYLL